MRFEFWLKTAFEKKAQQLWLRLGDLPRVRTGETLEVLSKDRVSQEDLTYVISRLLTNQEQVAVNEGTPLTKELVIDGLGVDVRFFSASLLQFNLMESATDWSQTQNVIDLSFELRGLRLFVSQSQDTLRSFFENYIATLVKQKAQLVLVVSDQAVNLPEIELAVFQRWTFAQALAHESYLQAFDQVCVLTSQLSDFSQVSKWALQGAKVSHFSVAADSFSALKILQQNDDLYSSAHLITLLAQVERLPSLKDRRVGLVEALFLNKELQTKMQNESLEDWMQLREEQMQKPPSRSLNQSLCGLLLKREISVQPAFAMSPDPVELDNMLKKIGV